MYLIIEAKWTYDIPIFTFNFNINIWRITICDFRRCLLKFYIKILKNICDGEWFLKITAFLTIYFTKMFSIINVLKQFGIKFGTPFFIKKFLSEWVSEWAHWSQWSQWSILVVSNYLSDQLSKWAITSVSNCRVSKYQVSNCRIKNMILNFVAYFR